MATAARHVSSNGRQTSLTSDDMNTATLNNTLAPTNAQAPYTRASPTDNCSPTNGASAANATLGASASTKSSASPAPARAAIQRPRDTGSASENSAPLPDLHEWTAAAEECREDRQQAREILLEPLRPDIAAKRPHDLERLFEFLTQVLAAGDRARAHRGNELLHSREARHGAAGEHEQQRQTEQKTPARIEPGFVPEHFSSPRLLLRERFL